MPAETSWNPTSLALVLGAIGSVSLAAHKIRQKWRIDAEKQRSQAEEESSRRIDIAQKGGEAMLRLYIEESQRNARRILELERAADERDAEIQKLRAEIFTMTQRHRAEMDTADRRYQELSENYGEALARIEALENK